MNNVPCWSRAELQEAAADFLARYHPCGSLPVPIEEIVEFKLKIEIVPLPSLRRSLRIDGYISSDFQRITVDEELLETKYINRYRFTLAHEVGHRWLHADFIRSLNCSSVANWRVAMTSISKNDYGWMEWHANCFASHVLVPPDAFQDEMTRLKSGGTPNHRVFKLASRFQVSTQAVELRLKNLVAIKNKQLAANEKPF